MANDKDFIVKNAVEVGGSTKTTLGTVTNDDIDLSTGNYFAHTPVGATTYTISNAGDVQTFQVEVTGGTEEVAQDFSTTIYSGNSADRDIVNNIDLATDGGMVWIKSRTSTTTGFIFDTERGATKSITPSEQGAQETDTNTLKTFNTDGFSTGSSVKVNGSNDYVSWTFKKEPNFFDVVTYTGDGNTSQTISHNLGSTPAMIIVKNLTTSQHWAVYHRSTHDTSPENYRLLLSANSTRSLGTVWWNNTAPTSTQFTVGSEDAVNENNSSFVAYLFAHDTADDGLIQCGGFTEVNGSDVRVTLGWKPQWIMIKTSSTTGNWGIYDLERGWTDADSKVLIGNLNNSETTVSDRWILHDDGFTWKDTGNAREIVYVAIRSAADLDLTWPTSIEWAGGATPPAPATGETDIFTISTDDGGTTYQGFKTADNLS